MASLYYILLVLCGLSLCKSEISTEISSYKNESFIDEELDAKIVGVINSIEKQVFPTAYRVLTKSNVSMPCMLNLFRFFTDLKKLKGWAWKMLDATGKPSAGLFEGTMLTLGDYDECLDINLSNARGKQIFGGKYCMVIVRPFNHTSTIFKALKRSHLFLELFKDYFQWMAMKQEFGINVGLCLPSSCTAQELNRIIRVATRDFIIPFEVNCETKGKKDGNVEQIAILCIFGGFGFMVIIGTCFDIINRHTAMTIKSGELKQLLIGFSFYANTIRFFRTVEHEKRLSALRGCRVLTAFWVILLHTYLIPEQVHFIKYRRLFRLVKWTDTSVSFRTVLGATLAMDVFFILSGMVFLYTNWRKSDKSKGPMKLLLCILQRASRILRMEMLVVGLLMILPLFFNGPVYDLTLKSPYNLCKNTWWRNLLFIQNFWSADRICLFHTWFIATLFQLFLLTFWVVSLLYRWPRLGIATNVTLILSGCLLTGLLTSSYNLPSNFSTIGRPEAMRIFLVVTYTSPHTYLPSYCTGLFLGYAIVKKPNPKIKPWIQIICWLASTCGALIGLYSSFFINVESNRDLNIVHATFHRAIWSASISWVLFACATGYGGIVEKLLSWKVLIILDQLALMIYLVHPLILLFRTAVTRSLINLGHLEQVDMFLATATASVMISFLLDVIFQKPLKCIDSCVSRMFSRRLSPDIKQPVVALSHKTSPASDTNGIAPSSTTEQEGINA